MSDFSVNATHSPEHDLHDEELLSLLPGLSQDSSVSENQVDSPLHALCKTEEEAEVSNDCVEGYINSSYAGSCSANSLHKADGAWDVPCGPPPYCSYWGPGYKSFEDPLGGRVYTAATLNNLVAGYNSPLPQSRLSTSGDFLDIVKACVARAVQVVVQAHIKKNCYGCQVDHPSQKQHSCLYPPDRGYFYANFEELMVDVLSWEFLPALKYTLEKVGLDIVEARVEGAADAFLYDLREEEHILEKVEEITAAYIAGDKKREDLLQDFHGFWNS